jgi:hypothetical protein
VDITPYLDTIVRITTALHRRRRYWRLELDDAIQEACLICIKRLGQFDPGRGHYNSVEFRRECFMRLIIRNHLDRCNGENAAAGRVPESSWRQDIIKDWETIREQRQRFQRCKSMTWVPWSELEHLCYKPHHEESEDRRRLDGGLARLQPDRRRPFWTQSSRPRVRPSRSPTTMVLSKCR